MPPSNSSQAIQAAVGRVNTYLDSIDKGIDNVVGDVTRIKDLVTKLQTTPGPISPDDQRTLDELEKRVVSLDARVKILDEMDQPEVPTDPTVPADPNAGTPPATAGGTGDPTAPGAGEPVVSPGGTATQPAPDAGTAGKPASNFP